MKSKQVYMTEVELEEFIWQETKGSKTTKLLAKEDWRQFVLLPITVNPYDKESGLRSANLWIKQRKLNFVVDDYIVEEPVSEFDSLTLIWQITVYG